MSNSTQPPREDVQPLKLERNARALFDSLAEGIIIFDNCGKIVDANSSATQLLGVAREDMLGHRVAELHAAVAEDGQVLSDEDRPGASTLRTGEPATGTIIGVDIPGHGLRWLSMNTRALIIDGVTVGVTSSFINVTERRKSKMAVDLFMALNKYLIHAKDEADLLQHMTDSVVEIGQYELAWLGIATTSSNFAVDVNYASGATDYLEDNAVSWSGAEDTGLGPTGTAIRTGTVQVANDLATQPGYEPWRARAEEFGFGSSISVPFRIGSRPAVLAIYARNKFAFDEATVERLTEITSEFGFGVAHVRAVRTLRSSLDGTLSALTRLGETRDPYTAGHQHRVGELAMAIGHRLGLDDALVDLIRKSGQVHDIGKTSVPAEILTRPGRLNDLEFDLVKLHTTVGHDILSQANLPWPISDVALQHHERMDGSGYPHGLRGADIALPARIVAVADVVEAMTQHRPYRAALELDCALEEITRGSGVQYDADVVTACLALFASGYRFSEPRYD